METRGERRYPVVGSSALEASEDILNGKFGLVDIGGSMAPRMKVIKNDADTEPAFDELAYPDSPGLFLDDSKLVAEPAPDQPNIEPAEETDDYSFKQTQGKVVDERKLAVSSLVRNFRARDVQAVVLKAESSRNNNRVLHNTRIDAEGATFRGIVAKLTKMASPDTNEDEIYQRLTRIERLFISRYLKPSKDTGWDKIDKAADKYSATDLMRNIEIFNSVMYDFHGPLYMQFCERLRRFGGYLITKES